MQQQFLYLSCSGIEFQERFEKSATWNFWGGEMWRTSRNHHLHPWNNPSISFQKVPWVGTKADSKSKAVSD